MRKKTKDIVHEEEPVKQEVKKEKVEKYQPIDGELEVGNYITGIHFCGSKVFGEILEIRERDGQVQCLLLKSNGIYNWCVPVSSSPVVFTENGVSVD